MTTHISDQVCESRADDSVSLADQSSNARYHPAFNASDADMLLCSQDNVLFRVHSHTLRLASGWFRTLLSLPQSGGSPPLAEIHVSESSDVIAGLLSMISGQEIPNFHTLEFLQDILYAAEKYEMVGPISIIRLAIVKPSFLDKYPVRVYGIACKMGWIEEAKFASSKTLAIDLLAHDAVKDLSAVESPHLAALFLLHRRRRDSLRGKLDSNVFFANERPTTCFYCKKELAPPFDWMHLKYVWTTLAELQPGVLGSNVLFRRPELWDVLKASCQHCQKPLYNSQNTISSIMLVLDSLPTEIEL